MGIKQGDVYWVDLEEPSGSEAGYRRPCVVIQNNLFNQSRIHTVIVCPLTTNLDMARFPGNVCLESGEGNLPKPSVIIISQILSLDKKYLAEYCGELSPGRIVQIIEGIQLLILPAETDS